MILSRVFDAFSISVVHQGRDITQVGRSVIVSNAVDVVDLVRGPLTSVQEPDDAVCLVKAVEYLPASVTSAVVCRECF